MNNAKYRQLLLAGALVLVGSFTAGAKDKRASSTDPDVLAERLFTCAHLTGEFGSGDPDREKELNKTWEELECDDKFIRPQIAAARKKYAGQPEKLEKLEKAIKDAKTEYGAEY